MIYGSDPTLSMKNFPLALCCLLSPLLACAQQTPPSPAPQAVVKPAPLWNVRTELLVVDLPQEKALALLPDLRDETKIDGAYVQIIELIQHKEATLVGYPVVQTRSGQKGTSETIDEMIYPTQFQPPVFLSSGATPPFAAAAAAGNLMACPTNFEKRNLGVTLEIEPVVGPGGKWIDLNLQPQHVVFEGFDWFETGKNDKTTASLPQPRFFTTKVSTSFMVRNGQRVLCEMHKLLKPEGQVELFILQATTSQVGD